MGVFLSFSFFLNISPLFALFLLFQTSVPTWTKKLQQFAVEKKQKSIFYKSQQKRGFKLSKSKIHGRGLFATRKFSPDEEIIEYVGELIRPIIADLREDWYRKNGQGNYMFTLNEERVIDASQLSSMARFINHCCEPNCVVTNYWTRC